MLRQLRTQYPGAIQHAINRGDTCEPIRIWLKRMSEIAQLLVSTEHFMQ